MPKKPGQTIYRRGAGIKHPLAEWKNMRAELERITGILGRFPTQGDLKKILKRHDVLNALKNHHSGIGNARKKMGFSPTRQKKPGWKKFRQEYLEVAKRIGRLPNLPELQYGNARLFHAMNSFGGIKVREKILKELSREGPLPEWAVIIKRKK